MFRDELRADVTSVKAIKLLAAGMDVALNISPLCSALVIVVSIVGIEVFSMFELHHCSSLLHSLWTDNELMLQSIDVHGKNRSSILSFHECNYGKWLEAIGGAPGSQDLWKVVLDLEKKSWPTLPSQGKRLDYIHAFVMFHAHTTWWDYCDHTLLPSSPLVSPVFVVCGASGSDGTVGAWRRTSHIKSKALRLSMCGSGGRLSERQRISLACDLFIQNKRLQCKH